MVWGACVKTFMFLITLPTGDMHTMRVVPINTDCGDALSEPRPAFAVSAYGVEQRKSL